jgi:lysophospholipase L1-like esterase
MARYSGARMDTKLLLPIAVLQGLWVLQRTPRLPSPVGRGGRYGVGLGSPMRVVGLGDSIMAGTGVREQCDSLTATYARLLQERLQRDVEWRVHGFNGATSASVLHKLAPGVPAAHVYVLSVGVNDVTRGVDADRFARNFEALVKLLHRKSAAATILFGGLPPLECFPVLPWPLRSILAQRARDFQQSAVEIAARHERVLCFRFPSVMPAGQLASDGFHPAESACQRWAEGLLELWPAPH